MRRKTCKQLHIYCFYSQAHDLFGFKSLRIRLSQESYHYRWQLKISLHQKDLTIEAVEVAGLVPSLLIMIMKLFMLNWHQQVLWKWPWPIQVRSPRQYDRDLPIFGRWCEKRDYFCSLRAILPDLSSVDEPEAKATLIWHWNLTKQKAN